MAILPFFICAYGCLAPLFKVIIGRMGIGADGDAIVESFQVTAFTRHHLAALKKALVNSN